MNFRAEFGIPGKKEEDSITFHIQAELLNDVDEPFSLTFEAETESWPKEAYVFFPGAVYNGNRMKCEKLPYPPYHEGSEGVAEYPVITDIPHLSAKEDGRARTRIQLCSGDMSTPAMGFYKEDWQEGILIFSRHYEHGEYTGFSVEERGNRAVFSVSCPAVREKTKYFFGDLPDGSGFYPSNACESDDEGIYLMRGEKLELEVKICTVETREISQYFKKFNELKEEMEQGKPYNTVPFSKAYEAIKEKYVKENFTEEGYYRVGTQNTAPPSFWQAGWVGGGMNTYPFLMEDQGTAREQAMSTLRFISSHLQRENGWFVPMYANGKEYGDCFYALDKPVLLARKDGDLLYFLLKQIMYLKESGEPEPELEQAVKAQADAFVRYFKKNGEISQFLDMEKEVPLQKGTASAAIVPARLALVSVYFGEPEYLKTAEALGAVYLEDYLHRGIVNGGPGEICQAPDSESAFALLESYVELYEISGNEKWLRAAIEAFELAWTWVMSYDFKFPKFSTAERMQAHSRGTVFANAQNKHSAPGICTLSGNSMLKLYRFTGEERYLEALRRISHAIPQFVSLANRPVNTLSNRPLPSGYINERVQTSDWEGKETVGEFQYGSNWPEVSMLLTYVEVPGIYLDLDKKKVVCFDHVKAEIVGEEDGNIRLQISNPTTYEAKVLLMTDHSENGKALGEGYYKGMKQVTVPIGQTVTVSVEMN